MKSAAFRLQLASSDITLEPGRLMSSFGARFGDLATVLDKAIFATDLSFQTHQNSGEEEDRLRDLGDVCHQSQTPIEPNRC